MEGQYDARNVNARNLSGDYQRNMQANEAIARPPQAAIPGALDSLEKVVQAAYAELEILGQRMEPVMASPTPEKESGQVGVVRGSGIADRIRSIEDMARSLRGRISNLTNRLEV